MKCWLTVLWRVRKLRHRLQEILELELDVEVHAPKYDLFKDRVKDVYMLERQELN